MTYSEQIMYACAMVALVIIVPGIVTAVFGYFMFKD